MMAQIHSELKLTDVNIMDKILSDQDRIIWENMGLTPDVQSMENAALLTKVPRTCSFRKKKKNYRILTNKMHSLRNFRC